jgi:ribosomal protein S18 acetylase RimI-like enzyme
VTIRRARLEDAPAIARVWFDAWQTTYRGLVPEEVLASLSLEQRTEYWRSRLEHERATLVTGDVDGYCRALPASRDPGSEPRTSEIASLYVHPDRQRRGLGSALLEATLADLPCDAVTLWVFAANAAARAFYAAHGFTPDGREQLDPGTGLHEIRMRL